MDAPGGERGAARRFRPDHRFTIGLAVAASLVVLAGVILRAVQESAIETLKRQLEEEDRVSELIHRARTALLEARRYDDELSLSYRQTPPEAFDSRYLRPVAALLAGVRQDLGKLQGTVDDAQMLQDLRSVQAAIDQYEAGYTAVVELYRGMGAAAGGLEAQILDQEEQLRLSFGQQRLGTLAERLIELRIARSDYFSRHQAHDAEAVRAATQAIGRELAASGISAPARRALEALLDQYRALFERYAEAVEQVNERRAAFMKTAAEAAPRLDRVLSRMRSRRALADGGVSLNEVIGYAAGVGGLVTLLAAGWLAFAFRRSLAHAIEASVEFARRLERGDFSARVPEAGTPALRWLGAALNDMARSLARARDEHLGRLSTLQQEIETLRERLSEQQKAVEAARGVALRLEKEYARCAGDLAAALEDVRVRDRETMLFNEMSSLLHTCRNDREAFDVIDLYAGRLFPLEEGALLLLNAARDKLECLVAWGGLSPKSAGSFGLEACLALRLGHIHQVEDPASSPVCEHVRALGASSHPYLCLPMVAGGDTLGVLHLSFPSLKGGNGAADSLWERKRNLAKALADQIALAVSNIRLRDTLHRQSIRDPLTGLFNRRYLEESLRREVARAERTHRPLALLMLDVDYFKRFNDTHGHEAGDAVLRALGRLLRQSVREGDIACRFGGEEFVVLLPETTLEIARQRAEKIRDATRQIRIHRSGRYLDPISVSFGVAVYPDHGTSADALLNAADAALYQAKQSGRDRVMISLRA
ncbi:sensor domain-containing diguanylate cyclase [Pelomicrobium methylotrophicum]|uniref:sensor domain-containing diguanylate cyclase n=1 Tax=Pelomicrobium methylotrophicum TaxID=2602750 RepID=UPI001969F1D3|nr:sensor domain-containing diguanylate cyclase [Pelomicrobium methylotrophicum]